jgi:hypothetical protein
MAWDNVSSAERLFDLHYFLTVKTRTVKIVDIDGKIGYSQIVYS